MKELDLQNRPWQTIADTIDTGNPNEYVCQNDGTNYGRFCVVCEAPSGVYKVDSVDVKMEPVGGDGAWYGGKDSQEVNFELKKK